MTDFSPQSVSLAIAERKRFWATMARRFHAHALRSPEHANRLRGDAWFCIQQGRIVSPKEQRHVEDNTRV